MIHVADFSNNIQFIHSYISPLLIKAWFGQNKRTIEEDPRILFWKSCKIDELRTFLGVDKATDPRKKPDLAMQAYEEEKAMLNGDTFGFDIENRKYFTNRFVN